MRFGPLQQPQPKWKLSAASPQRNEFASIIEKYQKGLFENEAAEGYSVFMVIESIREFNRAVPFAPYEIWMASGERYAVPHPDFILVSRKAPCCNLKLLTALEATMCKSLAINHGIVRFMGRQLCDRRRWQRAPASFECTVDRTHIAVRRPSPYQKREARVLSVRARSNSVSLDPSQCAWPHGRANYVNEMAKSVW
jgi:hypothetical protein